MNPLPPNLGRLVRGLALLLLCACPQQPSSPGTADATPPSFVQVVVRLEAPAAPNPRAEFDITNREIVRTGIGTDLTLRVIALVGDPQSGIGSITMESNLSWRCKSQSTPSEIIGIFQSVPLDFTPAISTPASPVTPLQINVVANPVGQTGCARSGGAGPIGIRGHVRVAATNGAGVVGKSRTLIVEFDDALGPATGTSTATGTMAAGTETLYMAECRSRGVPIPPGWHRNTTAWTLHGNLRNDNANMLFPGQDAYVWTYADPAVRGGCIALPRGAGGSRGGLAGVICQNATNGNACFWDSRKRDDANPMAQMPAIDWYNRGLTITELKDATNLTEQGSGRCPECHRGNNVFLIAPDAPTWASVLRSISLPGNFTTRVESSADNQGGMNRYIAVTGVGGQQRADPGWANVYSPGGCGAACHEMPANLSSMGMNYTAPSVMPPACGQNGVQFCYR